MPDAVAMIDAQCPKCRKRFGWRGRAVDRPPCPRCGHQVPAADRERDQAQMDEARGLFRELNEMKGRPREAWDKWQRARVAAGLTLRQAARILGTFPSDLSAIEQGRTLPTLEQIDLMVSLYRGDLPPRSPA
jgi:Zn ribbon nucleic-acid-binding protein/DNA-binding XRE family transcriptional regulator